jgi:hypothetical protein
MEFIATPALFGVAVWGCTRFLMHRTNRDAEKWLRRRIRRQAKIHPHPVQLRMQLSEAATGE